MKVNGRFFKVDMEKCVNCGLCVKNCPEENVKIVDGKFVFGGDCACCVRCSFNCPKDAFNIALLNGWRVNGNIISTTRVQCHPAGTKDIAGNLTKIFH